MPNRNALIDVRDSIFSSPEAKLAAENALYRLDNPDRVVQGDLTATAQPTEVKKPNHVSIDRVGLIFSGQEIHDDPAGFAAADARILASGRCETWDGPAYRKGEAEKVNAECAQHGHYPLYGIVDGDVVKLRRDGSVQPYAEFMLQVEAAKVPIKSAPVAATKTPTSPNYDPLAGHLAQQRENAEKAKRLAERTDARILEAQRVDRERLSPSTAQDL